MNGLAVDSVSGLAAVTVNGTPASITIGSTITQPWSVGNLGLSRGGNILTVAA